MGTSIRWTARMRALLRRWRGAPLTWLTAGGFVLMLATAIGTALTVDRFRQNAIESGRDSLESAVRLLARHFDREFEDFAVLQKSIIAELESHGIASADVFRSEMGTLAMHEVLRAKASAWSDVAGANVFDASGILINSSRRWPVANVSVADRDYFNRLKNDPIAEEEVEVVPGRLGNGPAIVFARRVSGPRGEFLGIVSRALAPEQLEAFFASTGLGEESSIAMHHQNGQLLARIPHVDAMIGQNFRQGTPEQMAVFERTFVTTQLASPIDGKDRIVASRLLTGEPLVVVATRSLDATLATWRTQTKFFVTVAVTSIGLLVLTLFLIFRQVTHRLSLEKQRLDTAMNTMSQGLLMFDQDERLIVCNRRYIEMYGLSTDVVKPGAHFRDVIQHRHDTGSFDGDVDAYCDGILGSVEQTHSTIVETGDGRLIEIKNQPGAAGGWLATHDDVTERIRANERIAHMAHYDALTDLPNRVLMRGHLERRVAELHHGKPFAILYIDVDEFKGVNDSLGHEVGDELLRQVASRLRACVSGNDLVARLGGDEFAIVKAGTSDHAELTVLAESILNALRVPVNCKGQEVPTDASIGIAVAPEHGDNLDDLLKRADLAMYAAKSEGRGTFRIFVPEYDAKARMRRQLELDLRQALARGEFEVHYQPLVDLAADVVTGCEALLRWRHPERGMVSPADFIPVAEDTGLIGEIGEWVLRQACAEAAGWPDNIHIAVNVSPVQFRSRSLALKVAAALADSGLAPRRLELEITETVLIRDDEEALTILQQLRELGVRIALDDFGTGYSSLSYLHRFPFDKIKIDRSFISDIGEPEDSSPIVQAVVHMAAARHMATTAEGVETEAQREVLRQLGCSQMQGWLFSPAVPAAKLKQLLSAQAAA
ncbi:diguanylate cyclase [Bradyrhizobium sacchari]|uniref:Diguanylate cyclase/phosphodiesterase n=1 Tax=Bradyrhizobium sacchari TaxID=1399419 RepID=A0A560J917_9BRAD|nr:EAL domain-containing protein [Bradyrhizobium sacchari]OPY95935.1 diguanylate cyclase [Bradyrhizobium sacchari]TWB48112.1 diguanylate cyclase/phosphodiesterase [Bradyrhizobium sacchari]TWB67536.1 diguanylate cyclase/phosphodiesterase [Bradyrhizobium sacchari]